MEENRAYKKSHPWIDFRIKVPNLPFDLWMAFGEVQSKCEHIAGVPLLPGISEKMHSIYMARGALATTAIEGNTLTEEQVEQHLEGNLKLPPSQKYLQQEIDNVLNCMHFITSELAYGRKMPLTVDLLKHYNRSILENLPKEEHVIPGEVRTDSVVVGNYRGAPAQDCEYLLAKLCDWIEDENEWRGFPSDYPIVLGLIKAIAAHIYLAWIHPFGDGNGRTARVVELHLLMRAGVPSAAAHLLSNHYNQTRTNYYIEIAKTSKISDLSDFIRYATQGFVDGLKEQLQFIKRQQFNVLWIHLVHTILGGSKPTDIRRRDLLLDLSNHSSVPFSQIREISGRVANLYATKSDKTIRMDLNRLLEKKLIEKTSKGYRAKKEVVAAFLPVVTTPSQ